MEERSKTNKEIFDKKYPVVKLVENPMLCVEAIGYLKALIEYFPSEKEWVSIELSTIWTALLFHLI